MSEHVTIERGQWWFSNDNQTRCYICGFDPDGDPVFLTEPILRPDTDTMVDFLACWHHEPRCTGWEWQPEPDPDEWVTQDRVHMRPNIDETRWVRDIPGDRWVGEWKLFDGFGISYMHGAKRINDKYYRIEVRCRRRYLPLIPEPKPATQTIVFYEVIRRIAVCNEKKEEVITWTSYPMDSDFRTGETREVVR